MKKLLVAFALLTSPVLVSAVVPMPYAFAATIITELGDLSALQTVVADTQKLVAAGDLAGAQTRLTDFETAWDADASRLRALSVDKWDAIDVAADKALESLRVASPVQADAATAIADLATALDNPGAAAPAAAAPAAAPAATAAAVVTTDANGRPLPCEEMLAKVRAATPGANADKATADAMTSKGLERCNADDDKRADDFFAQALEALTK